MTLIIEIEYDGTNYSGWQEQRFANTLQSNIERAVEQITGIKYKIIASGRTDAGVHAIAQIAHISNFQNNSIPAEKIPIAVNSKLNKDIRIKNAIYYNGNFHSRFDAIRREYKYFLTTRYIVFDRNYKSFIRYPIDFNILSQSAKLFTGKKDFTTFSKFNADQNNPVCEVSECSWEILNDNEAVMTIVSNHFLYGMVRSVAGASIDIARGKRTAEDIESAFGKLDRNCNSPLAPPQGLYLSKVIYEENIF